MTDKSEFDKNMDKLEGMFYVIFFGEGVVIGLLLSQLIEWIKGVV